MKSAKLFLAAMYLHLALSVAVPLVVLFAGEWTAEQIVFDGKARELGAVRCRAEHNHRAAWYGVDAFDWSFTAEEALRKLLFTITGRHARIS